MCCPLSPDSAGGGGRGAVGQFYERGGGGGAVRCRPILRAGGRGGCCPLSADSTSVRGPL